MTTPTDPRDEVVEGQVRDLLWRLRARLVTPPAEERVRTDLDRLLAAARRHAHEVPGPSGQAPGSDVTAEPDDPPATSGVPDRSGCAAASFLLVVGIGGGIALLPTCVDGINSALGSGGRPAVAPASEVGDADSRLVVALESARAWDPGGQIGPEAR